MNEAPYPILQIEHLRKQFDVAGGRKLTAVDDVSLELVTGETLALVGESGSGKSTVARCIVRLIEPTGGQVYLAGNPISHLNRFALSQVYRQVQMVFQDPNSSLNPRMTIRQTLSEPLRLHLKLNRKAREERLQELVRLVDLRPEHLDRYPHQLSGGQRQRIGIARALAVEPKVVILDEPTASLDVSVRGYVLDLLLDLQQRLGLAYLFITHDLQVVRHLSHRVAVMYVGGIVEEGATADVFADPRHPYTRALLSAAPVPEWGRTKERFPLSGEIPSPIDLADECRLISRCPLAEPSCGAARPPLVPVGDGHRVACVVATATAGAIAVGSAPGARSIPPTP